MFVSNKISLFFVIESKQVMPWIQVLHQEPAQAVTGLQPSHFLELLSM